MANKLCLKILRYMRLAFVFLGALTIGGVYFGGDVYAVFGALMFTLALWGLECWLEGEWE